MPSIGRNFQFQYSPGFGPEWGSGGIFGLKHHRGVLFFDLAFEAEAHFSAGEEESVYRFDLLGEGPRSGGDTYNAVEAVDNQIYFGGWVHAPAVYQGRRGAGGTISFRNKFSHLHSYDIGERKVKLLWSDNLANDSEWAGEVSDIIYDPLGDRLLLSRADGHRNLGIYAAGRKDGRVERVSELPGFKGAHFLDYLCFDVQHDWLRGMEAVQTLDPVSGKWSVAPLDFPEISVDGGGVPLPSAGCALSAYSNLFFFVRGGVIVGDPVDAPGDMRFLRLFDFRTPYAPSRTMAKSVVGGVMVAFNAYSHGARYQGGGPGASPIAGPSVLVYITPPQARIVGAFGARVTGFEKIGGELMVAASNEANLGLEDATPTDTGHRDLTLLRLDSLLTASPPVAFHATGSSVGSETWGGIPIDGYSECTLLCDVKQENRVTINEYHLSIPVLANRQELHELAPGRNRIDLSGYHGVLSFRLEKPDLGSHLWVSLR